MNAKVHKNFVITDRRRKGNKNFYKCIRMQTKFIIGFISLPCGFKKNATFAD